MPLAHLLHQILRCFLRLSLCFAIFLASPDVTNAYTHTHSLLSDMLRMPSIIQALAADTGSRQRLQVHSRALALLCPQQGETGLRTLLGALSDLPADQRTIFRDVVMLARYVPNNGSTRQHVHKTPPCLDHAKRGTFLFFLCFCYPNIHSSHGGLSFSSFLFLFLFGFACGLAPRRVGPGWWTLAPARHKSKRPKRKARPKALCLHLPHPVARCRHLCWK